MLLPCASFLEKNVFRKFGVGCPLVVTWRWSVSEHEVPARHLLRAVPNDTIFPQSFQASKRSLREPSKSRGTKRSESSGPPHLGPKLCGTWDPGSHLFRLLSKHIRVVGDILCASKEFCRQERNVTERHQLQVRLLYGKMSGRRLATATVGIRLFSRFCFQVCIFFRSQKAVFLEQPS